MEKPRNIEEVDNEGDEQRKIQMAVPVKGEIGTDRHTTDFYTY